MIPNLHALQTHLFTHPFPIDFSQLSTDPFPYPISSTIEGITLHHPQLDKPFVLHFDQGALKHRQRHQGELLFKATGAAKQKSLHIVDATAGLGRESVLMASAGAQVSAFERKPLLYFVLHEAWTRWENQKSKNNLCFYHGIAQKHFATLAKQRNLDVIYLDPMFPTRLKKAAIKREALILQSLSSSPPSLEEETELLEASLEYAVYRVVVKRPIKAPPLAQRKPTASIKGKMIRYDLYGKKKLP